LTTSNADYEDAPRRDSSFDPRANGVTVEFDAEAPMRDGVVLRANIYRPEGDGPWPTLLTRSPYDKEAPLTAATLDPVGAARQGFMVVVQDTRGRFASDGEWEPLRFERNDGYDSVEWAAGLPGSNGRVGMYGESYCGNSQWMAAVEQPSTLAAISPALTWSEPLDGLFARGGALELGLALPWTLQTGAAHLARLPGSRDERERRLTSLLEDYDRLVQDGYWDLPVDDMAVLRRQRVPSIGTLRLADDPDVSKWCRVAGEHDRVTVPSFHTAAWYDLFLQGTLDNYVAMSALGHHTSLVVGPWTHDEFTDPVGELCFGARSSRQGVPAHDHCDVDELQLAWLRRQLEGEPPHDPEAPVKIFVMGRNEWRDEAAWPLERAQLQRWYLGAGGALGRDTRASDAAATEFAYDPADPVPTLGGQITMAPAFPRGPLDQARVERRNDVCVFTSEALREDLEVTGRVRVVLHAESSAPSTDWVARLCDVHPDGRSFNICDGILRINDGANTCGQIAIDLWSTSNVFLVGHRLRVQVTSSSFPRWDRNLNTGDQSGASFQVALQRVHHDVQRPSWIELPVIA
jgi:putative CocE/NonD family hydrolase